MKQIAENRKNYHLYFTSTITTTTLTITTSTATTTTTTTTSTSTTYRRLSGGCLLLILLQ